MSPMAWLLGVLTSPLWLGWLYLPWGPWRVYGVLQLLAS
jgi:hypothetical protein